MFSTLTTEQFIEKARAVHGKRYDYSCSVYQRSNAKILIFCQIHNLFEQTPLVHLQGKGCPRCAGCRNQADFITMSQKRHGGFYSYELTVYTASKVPLTITCPIHGPFQQQPRQHLAGNGCKKCGELRKGGAGTLAEFINNARVVHGDKYNYSQAIYRRAGIKLTIICPIHGIFEQTPHKHLTVKRGCQKCAHEEAQRKQTLLGRGGWHCTEWQGIQRGRLAVLYVVQLSNSTEQFYKIGITYDFKNRFKKHSMPYTVKPIAFYKSSDAKAIYDLEDYLLREFRHLRYTPKTRFNGRNECFSSIEGILLMLPNSNTAIMGKCITLPS